VDFPDKWSGSLPPEEERQDWDEKRVNLHLSSQWKNEKEEFVRKELAGLDVYVVESDLSSRAYKNERYLLYNDMDCCKEIAKALGSVSLQAQLLMRVQSKEKAAQEAAKFELRNWFKTTLHTTAAGTCAYAILNGAVVAVQVGSLVAAEGGSAALIAGGVAVGGTVGTAAAVAVVAVPIFVVSAAGVGGWYLSKRIVGQ